MRITEPYTLFLRTLQSGRKVYYYQYRDENGRRSPAYSTGTDSLAQAKRTVQKLYREGKLKQSSGERFGNFTYAFFDDDSEYLKWKQANGTPIKPETVYAYRKALKNQLLPFFGELELEKINVDTVKKWVIWASEKWSAKTINNAQGVLNIIFTSALEKEIIAKNPLAGVAKRKLEKKERTLLTVEELKSLYHAEWKRETVRNAFLLTAVTGMRIGEVIALQKENVFENYLDVKHSYSRRFGLGSTKTGEKRFVPIPNIDLIKENGAVWVFEGLNENKPLHSHEVYDAFCRICEQVGIDRKGRGLTIHSLRNFFISYLQSRNVPEPKIRAVVGHAENTMTDLYTYWKPDMFPEVYEAQRELFEQIRG